MHFLDSVTVMQWLKGRARRLVLMSAAVTPSLLAAIMSARNSTRLVIITLATSPRPSPALCMAAA